MNPKQKSISPRIVNQSRLAEYLGKSKGWLSTNLPKLKNAGFPSKIDLLDGYDLHEVDNWIDGQKNQHKNKRSNLRINGTFK